ncbi:CBS domain-containing protein [Paraburkholderia sp. A3BS-1L]|uniref:CBS domain-containing protein n=1 Tax=Paraburkholderia sp. A3BS-1L TaxID=3028375 RepID=UPI003DA8CEFE
MRAIDVMATAVVLARPDITVQEAAKMLADHHISGMPVVDTDGKLVGIVTEGDLLHRTEIGTEMKRRGRLSEFFASTRELASEYVKEHSRLLSEVMTTDVVTAKEETPLAEIAELMNRHRIKRVPVLRDGKVTGLVSRANLIRVLASIGPDLRHSVTQSDSEIRRAILNELSRSRWALQPQNVIVTNGVAHLWGVIRSEDERNAIRVAAENVSGVREVQCHLDYASAPLY